MSKKNNKTRKKQYIETLKKLEKENEEEARRRRENKAMKIAANNLLSKIEDIEINENSDKMEVEKKLVSYHRKKRRNIYKHGRYS